MNHRVRIQIDMGQRVLDFCRGRGAWNPGYDAAVDQLDQCLSRAELLAQHEVAGFVSEGAAVVDKEKLRLEIHQAIGLLSGIARTGIPPVPELAIGIVRPRTKLSHQAYLAQARVAAETALVHRELLLGLGMPEDLPDFLAERLDRFERALADKHSGQAAHVGARAGLRALSGEILERAQHLDALNRIRFKGDAESLAGWKNARDVAWKR